jgi:hypothetical protein
MAAIARSVLWTASNLAFSTLTLNCLLVLLGVGLVLRMRAARAQRPNSAEIVLAAGSVVFLVVPVYATLVFAQPGEAHPFANWWYTAGLSPGLAVLSFRGLELGGRPGRWIGCGIVLLAAYTMSATYFLKLIPAYTGWEGQGRLAFIRAYYGLGWHGIASLLSETAMAPGNLLLLLASAVGIVGLVACVAICRVLGADRPEESRTPETPTPPATIRY